VNIDTQSLLLPSLLLVLVLVLVLLRVECLLATLPPSFPPSLTELFSLLPVRLLTTSLAVSWSFD
jgi:hypothetical protein